VRAAFLPSIPFLVISLHLAPRGIDLFLTFELYLDGQARVPPSLRRLLDGVSSSIFYHLASPSLPVTSFCQFPLFGAIPALPTLAYGPTILIQGAGCFPPFPEADFVVPTSLFPTTKNFG